MNANVFGAPIFVRTGQFLIQEIASLADATDFLEEWPEELRDLIHETALDACYDVYTGRRPLSVAESAFAGFAKRAGIFEDPMAPLPWLAEAAAGDGRVPV